MAAGVMDSTEAHPGDSECDPHVGLSLSGTMIHKGTCYLRPNRITCVNMGLPSCGVNDCAPRWENEDEMPSNVLPEHRDKVILARSPDFM